MMRSFRWSLLLLMLLASGCSEAPVPAAERPGLELQQVLGGAASEGFLRAIDPRSFDFPPDHGLHPGYRNEWWYLTGNLASASGRRFGYQLTFFTSALPQQQAAQGLQSSAWDSERIWMAHLGLTDAASGQHYAFERFSRENPGLAGARVEPDFQVWLDDWHLRGTAADDTLPWQLQAAEAGVGLSLQLHSAKAPVLQGDAGLSRKSATQGNASYYYSMTRLPTTGEILLGNERIEVAGLSWLDREWSTSALESGQTGWDWFSLQFDDGTELMYYQLRGDGGAVHSASAGNFTDRAGAQHALGPHNVTLVPEDSWTSPAGTDYDTQWLLRWSGRELRIRAIVQQQWMNLSLPYWEGAVELLDAQNGAVLGRGYLEMVR